MNYTTLGLGITAFAYGCFTFYARAKKPHMFSKLEAMKQHWGEKRGLAIHVVAYSVLPILVGISLIVSGIQGKA